MFLDVGAHQGQTLEVVLDRFDRIYAFEPMPLQCEILGSNFGEYEHVFLFNYGLAGKTGKRKMYGLNDDMGATFYQDKERGDPSVVRECLFVRASLFFETHIKLEDTVIMKLNCEGAEVEIMNDLFDSGEIEKVDHVMIDFDVRKIPSQRLSEGRLLKRMKKEEFTRFSVADEVMQGATHRERTERWLDLV